MNKDNKKNNRIIYITIVFAVIALVLFGTIFFLFKSGKLNFNSKESDTKEVELKKTEKVTVKSDGVYITDVSEVVDKVMPSIVSITSKTVISSGRYGYNSGGYITQGAGSGVIVEENDKEIFILTNYHVVEDTTELSVKFIDNESYDASVRGISERKDIAIVTIRAITNKPPRILAITIIIGAIWNLSSSNSNSILFLLLIEAKFHTNSFPSFLTVVALLLIALYGNVTVNDKSIFFIIFE